MRVLEVGEVRAEGRQPITALRRLQRVLEGLGAGVQRNSVLFTPVVKMLESVQHGPLAQVRGADGGAVHDLGDLLQQVR